MVFGELKQNVKFEGVKLLEPMSEENETAWRVQCWQCGPVCLTRDQYTRQMMAANSLWACPQCGETASWDDDWYEEWQEKHALG